MTSRKIHKTKNKREPPFYDRNEINLRRKFIKYRRRFWWYFPRRNDDLSRHRARENFSRSERPIFLEIISRLEGRAVQDRTSGKDVGNASSSWKIARSLYEPLLCSLSASNDFRIRALRFHEAPPAMEKLPAERKCSCRSAGNKEQTRKWRRRRRRRRGTKTRRKRKRGRRRKRRKNKKGESGGGRFTDSRPFYIYNYVRGRSKSRE